MESFPGGLFALGAKYGPPRPAGTHVPIEWSTVPRLQQLFRECELRLLDRICYMRFTTVDEMIGTFREYFGPMKMLFDNAPAEKHAAIKSDLAELTARYNRATDGTVCVAMSYLTVIVKAPGVTA
jgi:hypothetical protein